MLLKREKNNVIRIVIFVVNDGFKNSNKWIKWIIERVLL